MATFSELEENVSELQDRADNNDDNVQSLSDNTDQNFNDVQSTLDDHSDQLGTLNDTAGQLTFPLTTDTINLIMQLFPIGVATLVSGSATITDSRISPNSAIFLSRITTLGTPGHLVTNPLNGTATIVSSTAADQSVIQYLIINLQ